ncbi:hypothetical protein [Psychromonas sp. GE-S-Ul-11]|uniref:hypothetical protein n=1 Tax=Psychromonas sp. GE-S-Ul-11 TaxID=3241170 RepID=UPI00390C9826
MTNSIISINQRYKSSTRIDSELADFEIFIDSFILHGTAVNVLDTISRDFAGSEQRAYTLTGPYGSGKSTLALYLASLLSANKKERIYATTKLDKADGVLDDFSDRFNVKNGWQVIKHVCGLEAPANAILMSIYKAFNIEFIADEIKALDDDECLTAIKNVLSDSPIKADGTLIFLDEMGKALDHQSRNNKDLHFFQSLADIAQQAKNSILLVGFLHQSFSDYAKNKDVKAQKEWAKVQGRYRDLSFNPSIDESLVLVGDSITKTDDITKALENKYETLINHVLTCFEHKNTNKKALLKTLPLDPVVSLLLGPISRRRFSQNERSLFGFLASYEKLGFREFLSNSYDKTSKTTALYLPEMLWDYLHYNLHHLIVTSHDSKAWLEGCDAIHRAEQKGSELHVSITKVISLLTIFGFQHQLHAKKEFIIDYFFARGESKADIKNAIKDLEAWTIVIYRQNHNALFVFQGSDIDIHSMVVERIESISQGVDWTKVCDIPQSILATAHYHKSGTMRWANTKLINKIEAGFIESLKVEPLKGASFLSFLLPANEAVAKQLKSAMHDLPYATVGEAVSLEKLKEVATELIALNQIAQEEAKIKHDLIAQKELESRIFLAAKQIEQELSSVFEAASWQHQGKLIKGRSLSQISSAIAENIFNVAPTIVNELVNRSKPSGSANSAIKKLLIRMVENGDEFELGFGADNFPPEKGLYLSCLVHKGLHQFNFETELGDFCMPDGSNQDMVTLFSSALEHLKSNQNKIIYLSELYTLWSSEPYGVAKGILPIWCLAFLLANTEHLAFYDQDVHNNDIFIAEPDEEYAVKLIKEPQSIGIKFITMDGIKLNHLTALANAINDDSVKPSTLKLAQEYVQFVSELSPWTKKTNNISKLAKGFRDLTLLASDPTQYLIEDIPKLFENNKVDVSVDKISEVISELRSAHEDMINGYRDRIASFFKLDEHLFSRCQKVANYTSDYKLETFASRLAEFTSNEKWVSSIISLLSSVAERNWNDMALEKANSELVQMIDKFKAASHYAVLGDLTPKKVDEKFNEQLTTIKSTLNKIDPAQKRAILLRLLESFEEEDT